MYAVRRFGFTFPELEMQMRIRRVFLTHRPNHIALVHMSAWNHPLRDTVEMEIDEEQVLSIGRIGDFQNDMRGAKTLTRPGFIRRPGTMHHASRHGMDRRADASRQVYAVMKIPTIRVDTRTGEYQTRV